MRYSLFESCGRVVALWAALFVAAWWGFPAHTQGDEPCDLATCVRLGLERNSTLQKLAVDVNVAREGISRASGVYDARLGLDVDYQDSELPNLNNPAFGATKTLTGGAGFSRRFSTGTGIGLDARFNRLTFDEFGSGAGADEVDISSAALSLSQPLLRNAFGRLDKARVGAALSAYEGARLRYLYERDRLAAQIYAAYWNANAALKRFDVNEASLVRSRELLETNRKKFDDGLIDETEILAAEASLATREVDVLGSRDDVVRTRDLLLELMAVPVDHWDEVEIAFHGEAPEMDSLESVDMTAAFEEARVSRPDLAALQALKQQAARELVVQKQEARADLELRASIGRGDVGNEVGESLDFDHDVWSVGVALEVPLWRTAAKAAVRQAELQTRRIDHEYEALERAILLECRLSVRYVKTSAERVKATKRALDLQRRKLELEQKKLAQGRSTTRFVIEYQDDLEFAQLAAVDAVARFEKDLARYRLVQGILLQTIGLDDAGLGEDLQ